MDVDIIAKIFSVGMICLISLGVLASPFLLIGGLYLIFTRLGGKATTVEDKKARAARAPKSVRKPLVPIVEYVTTLLPNTEETAYPYPVHVDFEGYHVHEKRIVLEKTTTGLGFFEYATYTEYDNSYSEQVRYIWSVEINGKRYYFFEETTEHTEDITQHRHTKNSLLS